MCRDILIDTLYEATSNGTLDEVSLIKIIHECGDIVLNKIKSNIKNLIIMDASLPERSQIQLALIMKACCPLQRVAVSKFTLNAQILGILKDCRSQIHRFEVSIEVGNGPS